VKADKRQIERALDHPGAADFRCVLLYGPDEAGSLALADRMGKAMGAEAERIDLDGATLKADPARLADEAASTSLFGGARWIRVRANGDEALDAVEALLAAPQAGNPVAIVAGALKPASKLLKLALASPAIVAFASYLPDAKDAVPLVTAIASELNLRMSPDQARRIFDAAAGDRAVIARELEKLALFVDAGADRPVTLTTAALDALGAGDGESSSAALIDAVLTGNCPNTVEELRAVAEAGEDGVPLVRATLRRLMQLASLRAEADASSLAQAMNGPAARSLFWKEKATIEAELRRWTAPELARLVERITDAQAQLLASGGAGPAIASQELLTIARAAARGR
jgi:DNA polymerase III subunit delta